MLIVVLLFHVCFFFKQKTAYEMRISDWSSDVCSSDLRPPASRTGTAAAARPAGGDPAAPRAAARRRLLLRLRRGDRFELRRAPRGALLQIGRASCRERVCQYV